MKKTHAKIDALKLRANPVTMSGSYVDAAGQLQTVDLKLEVREEDRIVKGYLTVWGVKDTYGTVMVKGCCAKSIRERGPKSTSKQKIAHLWQHEIDNPTGQFLVLEEDDYGLYFEARLDDVPIGERELKQIRSGTLNQFSIGFDYVWDKMEYEEERDAVILHEIELMEGSVVTFGSNEETYALRSLADVNEAKELLIEETEDFLKKIPRSLQLELRQLITKHVTLTSATEPEALRKLKQHSEKEEKPEAGVYKVGDYKLNLTKF